MSSRGSVIRVTHLKTEYATNPLGIDVLEPRLSWRLETTARGQYQSAYRIQVATSEARLLAGKPDVWDTGKVESNRSVHVPYQGERLRSRRRYYWRVQAWDQDGNPTGWSEPAWWEMGLLAPSDWTGQWIGLASGSAACPAPLLRREFDVRGTVRRARVYISGMGLYELFLNGKRVGDRVLDPGSTNYDRRVLYTTYDVTEMLAPGKNAIGVELGRGRYGMTTPSVWFWEKSPWHDAPKLLLQLEIEYEDGGTEVLASNESWKGTGGPTRFDSLYEGEVYDARLAQHGWASPGFDDSAWSAVRQVEPPRGRLVAHQHEPIQVIETIRPVSVTEVRPGVFVFDFGVNVSGWVECTAQGPSGTEITLVYGEKLHEDGTVNVDQVHIDAQIQTDRFILSGNGVETWQPKFSYKGFQYVQVTGFPGTPTLDSLKGRVIHTAVASTGEFHASEPLLNRIQANVRRAFLNNLYDVVTDTPVYEKNGWTGDAQVMAVTSIYNFHMPRFFTKWLHDIRETQRQNGELATIAPTSGWSYEGAEGWPAVHGPIPAWDASLFEIPWRMYEHYGDERILASVYEEQKRYFDYLSSRADGRIVRRGLGDWIPPGGVAVEGPEITSTTYYYFFATTLANVADILGERREADQYREIAAEIKEAFNQEFFDPETNVYNTSRNVGYRQTSNAFPLAFGLVPKDRQEPVLANLVKDIEERGNHLNTGILGTKVLLPVLTQFGYTDLAYAIATQRTYPSWGHWIENGATALYEHWELDSRSRNHHMFGTIGEWFYAYLAGIQPQAPGYERVTIKPYVPKALSEASARVETVRGEIRSSWRQLDGTYSLEVHVPGNVTATVYVPAERAENVTESGGPAGEALGVRFVGNEDGRAVYEVGSGVYRFEVKTSA